MRMLLMAGLGPYTLNMKALKGTLLEAGGAEKLRDAYTALAGRPLDLRELRYGPTGQPLLRPFRGRVPHLPTDTVRSIIHDTGIDYEVFNLDDLWSRKYKLPEGPFDLVGLSTTFICDQYTFSSTVAFISESFPDARLVVGGQFSNLKYDEMLEQFPAIDYVIRGDAEVALPMLIKALDGDGSVDHIPNLAGRDATGKPVANPIGYVDIESHPSPSFIGEHDIIPYESMRGCPFTCKFCSFPMASPEWRYKSAEKICADWSRYKQENNAKRIWARDSTFTIPPPRFRKLLEMLPDVGIDWDCYTRANVINSDTVVRQLEDAHCKHMLIGYESMSDRVLKLMDKKVSAAQNRRAVEVLAGSHVGVHGSFIVGYPGETLDDFDMTRQYLIEDYRGRYNLHFFTLQDETMPVWDDAATHLLEASGPLEWKHAGMDSDTALRLQAETLVAVRWKSEKALTQLWQMEYMQPLIPELDNATNLRLEKLLERLAFLPRDLGTGAQASRMCHDVLDELGSIGVKEESACLM